MAEIDFIELAKYCQKKNREAHTVDGERYGETLFVSIEDGDALRYSTTPHILCNARQCILVHYWSALAVTNWYSWYQVEFIDSDGCVHGSKLDENFKMSVSSWGTYSNQIMSLSYAGEDLYWFKWNHWDYDKEKFSKAWELYLRLKDIKTVSEIKLIAELYRKDDKILELEQKNEDLKFSNILLKQEKEQYQELLDEIKEIVENNRETEN